MLLFMIMFSLIIGVNFDIRVNFDIIHRCIKKLKPHKDDGHYGFNSDHLINGWNKLCIMLSIMFNVMLTHGFKSEDLLIYTIISIPKDNRGSMNSIKTGKLRTSCRQKYHTSSQIMRK